MVDKFIEYSDLVETLPEAFGFVMDHVDQFDAPTVAIVAREVYHDIESLTEEDESKVEIQFGVSVSGTVN